MFEVRVEREQGGYCIETRRTFEKDAQQDVELLKLFGKKAWIVELDP